MLVKKSFLPFQLMVAIILGVCFLALPVASVSATMQMNHQAAQPAEAAFLLDKANAQFDQIALTLSTQNLKVTAFESAIKTLKHLKNEALNCETEAKGEIKDLNAQLDVVTSSGNQGSKNGKDATYLASKKTTLTKQASDCRLFVIRADEALKAYGHTLHKMTTSALLAKQKSAWQFFFSAKTAVKAQSQYHWLKAWSDFVSAHWLWILGAIIGYLIYWLIIKLILKPFKVIANDDDQKPDFRKTLKFAFYRRLTWIGLVATVLGVFYLGLRSTSAPIELVNLVHVMGMTIIAGLVLWLVLLVERVIKYRLLAHFCVAILWLLFITIVVIAWIGYVPLASYVLWNIFLTVFGLLGVMVLSRLLNKVTYALNGKSQLWQKKFRHYLDLRANKNLSEMVILRIAGLIFIWIVYAGFLVAMWGWNTVYPEQFISGFAQGFKIAHITIEPLQIFIAVLTFIVLSLLGRLLSAHIARKYRRNEKDLQVALASIVSYISFAVALIIALLVSGVNFTGLAIIAGALSVGIGLGLQDIVNNFVSGIILLIEKPIRPGDRIMIGQTEGFVRKVQIRSTHIATIAKSDVIVPNADLIKNEVINYMYHDQTWRISAKVGVAYGSDIDLVKQTLLDVAATHEEIIQDAPDAPSVLFREFADSTLNFELWCVIRDVNRKFAILSDLNFAIDKAFREKNITIAFPQRDVHLYDHSLQPKNKK